MRNANVSEPLRTIINYMLNSMSDEVEKVSETPYCDENMECAEWNGNDFQCLRLEDAHKLERERNALLVAAELMLRVYPETLGGTGQVVARDHLRDVIASIEGK